MIVVKVELWPGGVERFKQTLGVATIINDGTGTAARGNYDVILSRRRQSSVYRMARVEDYPRKTLHFWNLIHRALDAALKAPPPKVIVDKGDPGV